MRYLTYLRYRSIFEGLSHHDDIPAKNQGGMCFQVASQYMLQHSKDKQLRLCHGLVTGQGAIKGVVYVHAWVERGQLVIDETLNAKIPKDMYYDIGNINKKYVYTYTLDEMMKKMNEFETYGPWERKLLNNKY